MVRTCEPEKESWSWRVLEGGCRKVGFKLPSWAGHLANSTVQHSIQRADLEPAHLLAL